ncbi:MAG: acyl-CoA dehydrogenase family protein [Planctomycetes bacterium]|nr:acyl-CoA dehydrogenase family protein [Planctomycetota bacterium]
MSLELSADQKTLRREIVAFARRELGPGAGERDREASFSRELWQACGRMSLPGLCVAEEHGGLGLSPIDTAVALEALGYGCEDGGLVFAICAHLLACVVPIARHGRDEQRAHYLPGLVDGRLIAVNGMTETESGSDAFAMSTTARPVPGGFILEGRKTFSSNGPVADLALVYAATDRAKGFAGGVTAFLVDTDSPGFSSGQRFSKMGLRSCAIGELVLEGVFVPEGRVLGGVGGGGAIFAESMNWERALLAASHVGTMERLLETAVGYARSRRSAGKAIGKYQAVAHKLADMRIRLEAARLMVWQAAGKLESARDASLYASMVKLAVSESLVESAMATVQVLGGYGIMTEYGVERVLRDAMASTIYSGTSEIQRNIVARWLGL